MAIDVKTITCPQCGSADVNMTSETQGVCKACGAQFTVQQRIDTQNVYNEVHVHTGTEPSSEENSCSKAIIIPEFSTDNFIRKSWITLAREDVPFDVFNQNFGKVSQTEHQVLMDSVSVNMTYQASIGYDRQEPYTAYENYKEQVLDHYEYKDGQQKAVYKTVTKQRPVTKYRTVTDWSAQHGNHSASSFATVENMPGQHLDEGAFISSFRYMSKESLSVPSIEKEAEMQVTDAAHEAAMSEHRSNLYIDLCSSLPGDHHKDVDYQIADITESSTSLYSCQEYEATLAYNGKTYSKHAFPFGKMDIAGDTIANEESIASVKAKKNATIPDLVWDKTKMISLITIVALIVSVVVSLAIKITALVVIVFAVGAALFVYNTILEKKQTKEITSKINAEIADYANNHKIKQRELLNEKLKSLGYEPVTADEL